MRLSRVGLLNKLTLYILILTSAIADRYT